jgi:hypothetical protein
MISQYRRDFDLLQPFAISRGARSLAQVIEVNISRFGCIGRGESLPYVRYGDSFESVSDQISQVPDTVTRADLQNF